jgi:uncharacterized protein YyaL (SSP411 family)
MPNHLISENSPYLLQHADNPVDWYPWGEEALAKAHLEDKPIFLSIGYAACHWCHVMAHESFEDTVTASLMNQYFVNIKVDREERPDLDSIYMNAVVTMTGQGGWPLNVFLTPKGEPFFGGTYFPPNRRYNLPSFREVLTSVHDVWVNDRSQINNISQQLTTHLREKVTHHSADQQLRADASEQAALGLAQSYDWKYGGWGNAPKFPQSMTIEFLLRRASRGDKLALEIASHALLAMCKGGMYDVVGGGFARYSTDNEWRVPHFEKMLYDNALLSLAYLHAYLLTQNTNFRRVCEGTLDFIAREMTHPAGGFFSSLDADSEGEEGKYYLWTPELIRSALPDPNDTEIIMAAYNVTEQGNFEGATVLQRALDDASLAEQFHIPEDHISGYLSMLHAQLLRARNLRVPPATDNKVLVFWNALALMGFAEAGRYLGRRDYVDVAMRNAGFLLSGLKRDSRLFRSWRNDRTRHNAYLEDYASLALALLSLYQSDPNPFWFTSSEQLIEEILQHFTDPAGGFFDTRDDHGSLITRPKDLQDNATPSGNSLAALALLQISAFTGRSDLRQFAERLLCSIQEVAVQYPTAFANWLYAIDYATHPVFEVAILGPGHDERTHALVNTLWGRYRPHIVSARADDPPPSGSPALLLGRHMLDHKPTAFVCQNFTCKLPVTTPDALIVQLETI